MSGCIEELLGVRSIWQQGNRQRGSNQAPKEIHN